MSTISVSQIKNPSAATAAITLDASGNATVPSLVPPGTVQFYAGNTAPAGWLKANGALVSRSAYSSLFTAIGIAFGSGDGATTFSLPDMRGEFPRGWDDGRGVDTGRAIATAQAQDWKGFYQTNTGQNTNSYVHSDVYMGKSTTAYTGNLFVGYWLNPSAAMGTKWDTSEIRPRNIALLAIIKF